MECIQRAEYDTAKPPGNRIDRERHIWITAAGETGIDDRSKAGLDHSSDRQRHEETEKIQCGQCRRDGSSGCRVFAVDLVQTVENTAAGYSCADNHNQSLNSDGSDIHDSGQISAWYKRKTFNQHNDQEHVADSGD